jgi:hypothetical protein
VPGNSFVRVRGLPLTTSLSDGYAIAPGTWTVSASTLPNLYITLPGIPGGNFEMRITLLSVDGTVLNEVRCTLEVSASPPPAPRIVGPAVPAAVPQSGASSENRLQMPLSATPMTDDDRALALRLLRKGDELLAEGNVAPARLLYEHAAKLGLAQAALALALTYDPAEFARLNVQGIVPDAREARRWYERARDLGAGEAEVHLRQLGSK